MKRQSLSAYSLPRDAKLEPILAWCEARHKVSHLLLTIRVQNRTRTRAGKLLKEFGVMFKPFIEARMTVRGWPGTELIGHSAKVFALKFDRRLAKHLVSVEPDLFEWRHDRLPEDLCVIASDQAFPVLISVTLQREAWVCTSLVPNIPGIEKEGISSMRPYVWSGEFYCKTSDRVKSLAELKRP